MVGKIVEATEWLKARKELLAREKALTKHCDELAKARSEMPMTKVSEQYSFVGDQGEVELKDLFDGKKQLIIYHMQVTTAQMYDPSWDAACHGCSFAIDNFPPYLEHLRSKETNLVVVGRASWEKIKAMKERMGWKMPFYSSNGSMFNYDFHVTQDENIRPIQVNYMDKSELEAKGLEWEFKGETPPGLSVFFQDGGQVFHSYSTFRRGMDHLLTTFSLLDLTPLGRQGAAPPFEYHDMCD